MPPSKSRRPKRTRRRWARPLAIAAAAAAVAVAVVLWSLHRDVDAFLRERTVGALRLYSDAFAIRRGVNVEGAHLDRRLRRLGYEETAGAPTSPGQFRTARDRIDLALRSYEDLGRPAGGERVRVDLRDGAVWRIVRLDGGGDVDQVRLEPELLGSFAGEAFGERRPIKLDALPRHVVSAVLAAEDARFARHPGIDPIGLVRAAWIDLRGRSVQQGGSTITQQLAKNLFLTPERSWTRKIREMLLALMLEARMSKQDILETYLDSVYLGRSGSVGIYGLAQGSRAFFGKEPRDLTVAEAATIAGVIHSPNRDSPLRHPDEARARRDQVLDLMADNGWLGPEEVRTAKAEPLRVRGQAPAPVEAPFFVDEVLRRLGRMGHSPTLVRGLSVFTTADVEIERAAERALVGGLEALEKKHARLKRADAPLEGAVAVVEAETGYVRALVGGRDFTRSQFNRATRSRRQPGSAFKPFVYLAALDDPDDPVTAATRLPDEPLRVQIGPTVWMPTNYDQRFRGLVTVRTALEESRNVPTVVLAQRIGMDKVVALAHAVGLGSISPMPAMALGAAEVSLVDLAGAYTVFPDLGEVARPAMIRGVVTDDGHVLYQDRLRRKRVATSAASYVASHLLEGVVEEGTAAAVSRSGLPRPLAGKTGTTNEEKDAWFVGYSPELVAAVWTGFDDGTPVGLTGAAAALPIWTALMREALLSYPARPFTVPGEVVFRDIERESGLLGGFGCGETIREAFIVGTEPTESCNGRRLEVRSGRERPSDRRPWNRLEGWLRGLFRR